MNYSLMNLQIDKKASLPVQAMSSDPPKPRGNKINNAIDQAVVQLDAHLEQIPFQLLI